MAAYIWSSPSGGAFGTAQNWTNLSTGQPGVPGASDTASITVPGIIVSGGGSVANLSGGGTDDVTLSGSFSATNTIEGFTLTGGSFSAGEAKNIHFSGASLSAATISIATLTSGEVEAGVIGSVTIDGAKVTAESSNESIKILSGSLEIQDMPIGDASSGAFTGVLGGTLTADTATLTSFSQLEVSGGGKATVTGLTKLQAGTFGGPYIWVGRNDIAPGHDGPGTLNLQGGLSMTGLTGENLTTFAGSKTTVAGTALIDLDSTAINSGIVSDGGVTNCTGTVILGQGEAGTLNVLNGGKATVKTLLMGQNAGARGEARATDAGSSITITNATVGDAGSGDLIGQQGSKISLLGALILGAKAGGDGSAFLADAGSTFTAKGAVTVGQAGAGQFDLTTGATADFTGPLTIGAQASGIGRLNLAGAGTKLTATGKVAIGVAATGDEDAKGAVLTIREGAVFDAGEGTVVFAERKGSTAGFLIEGANSKFIAGAVVIGGAGKAGEGDDGGVAAASSTLAASPPLHSVLNGGSMQVNRALTIGQRGSGFGSLTIAGKDSSGGASKLIATDRVVVGEDGTGKLSVTNGAFANVGGELVLGQEKTGIGQFALSGKGTQVHVSQEVGVGVAATGGKNLDGGRLSILSGAHLSVTRDVLVAVEANSTGNLVVRGDGSQLTAKKLVIGAAGTAAEHDRVDGPRVDNGGSLKLKELVIGEAAGSQGSLIVSGVKSKVEVAGKVTIGQSATGGATEFGAGLGILKDGVFISHGAMTVAQQSGSKANLLLHGDGSGAFGPTIQAESLTFGVAGKASGEVSNRAFLQVFTTLVLAEKKGSTASLSLTDAGSSLDAGSTVIGAAGTAALKVVAEADAHVETLTLGRDAGGKGTLEVANFGNVTIRGALTIGGEGQGLVKVTDLGVLKAQSLTIGATDGGGHGNLAVDDGSVTVLKAAQVWENATVNVKGVLNLKGGVAGDGVIQIGNGGTLHLSGRDNGVDISFVDGAGGISLASANLLGASVSGFNRGDVIEIGNLTSATFTAVIRGGNTVVTIFDNGAKEGALTLVGHYTRANLKLTADGDLTTTARGAGANQPSGNESGPSNDTFAFDHAFDGQDDTTASFSNATPPYGLDDGGTQHAADVAGLLHLTGDDFLV